MSHKTLPLESIKVAIIGGGAAGFFAAIQVKENYPQAQVTIFEKTHKLLSKVKISGGGRCNVTNATLSIKALCAAYPRGGKQLKKAFQIFNTKHMMAWLEERGIPLKVEKQNHVFPVSNASQTIIDCFLQEAQRLGVAVELGCGVEGIQPEKEKIILEYKTGEHGVFDKVIVATGGSPKRKGLQWLADLGHTIEDPVPSLFTFNMPNEEIVKLMGVAVEDALVSIQESKLKYVGPLMITHWGMSGPAILKLSAFGARALANRNYNFSILVNWANKTNQQDVLEELKDIGTANGDVLIEKVKPFNLPQRLWIFLIEKAGIAPNKIWQELGKKGLNKIMTVLTQDEYKVEGKTTFKEEFVTCGGISLNDINMATMQSKKVPNLYIAGEVMDIDGITGGYNFQAAWTTAFVAAQLK